VQDLALEHALLLQFPLPEGFIALEVPRDHRVIAALGFTAEFHGSNTMEGPVRDGQGLEI
jgi:hypothetical protein